VGPLLVPPVLEYVSDQRGEPHQPTLLLVGSTVLTLLAFVRMALLIRSEERAHHDLERARDEALEASRAKSMFLATMSHEIRTPLTMVLGAGEMLEETPLDELQSDLVRRMRRSGGLLRTLVDGILDFSRIEAGEVDLCVAPFDVRDLAADLVDVYLPRAAASDIGFECVLDPGVPRTVVGDRDRLLQVLSNLLDNAFKFTHAGQVRLEVRPCASGAPGPSGHLEILVADTGIGIPDAELAAVFESFRQVDGSTTRRYGGTGLGLAICRQLTELMGGSLSVTSEPGAGSVFLVRLPVARSEAALTDAQHDARVRLGGAPTPATAATASG
jgi:signal transduction histidine kinase